MRVRVPLRMSLQIRGPYRSRLRVAGKQTAQIRKTIEDLKALIGAAPNFPGPGFLIPTRNSDLLRWCLENGLRLVQPMTLMSLGLYNEPDGAFLPSVLY